MPRQPDDRTTGCQVGCLASGRVWGIQAQSENGLVIDLAGRQRMLNQRQFKETLLVRQGVRVDYRATRALFDTTLLIISLVVLIAGAILVIAVTRNVLIPIRRTGVVLDAVATGDLTQRLDTARSDELGTMASSINQAIEGISTAFSADQVEWEALAQEQRDAERLQAMVQSALWPRKALVDAREPRPLPSWRHLVCRALSKTTMYLAALQH